MFSAALSFSLLTLACAAPEQFRAQTDDGISIAAELLRPGRDGPLPTFILLSGAGPYTRRYSTLSGTTEDGGYQQLAQQLCAAGYPVVLFDERGAGASTGDYWATATTGRLSQDVVTLIRAVPPPIEGAARRFVLLGHSEGGTLATLAATLSPEVIGIVTLGAPAADLSTVMEWQLREAREVGAYVYEPLLAEHRERSAGELWYRAALALDPLVSAREVCLPTLVLHGTRDESVPVAHAALLGESICAGRDGYATVRVLNEHDHSLTGSGDGDSLSPETLLRIHEWLEKHFGAGLALGGATPEPRLWMGFAEPASQPYSYAKPTSNGATKAQRSTTAPHRGFARRRLRHCVAGVTMDSSHIELSTLP